MLNDREKLIELLDEIADACSDIDGGYHCNKCPIGIACRGANCDIRRWLEMECDT